MSTLPPSLSHSSLRQLHLWVTDPIGFMREATRRHGDSYVVRFPGSPPFVFTSNPELVRQVFTGKPEDLYAGPPNRIVEFFLGQHSLLLLDGEEHIRERRMMTPAFHGERMLAYGHSMRESAGRSIDQWPMGQPFALHKEMQEITLDVILRTVFGLTGQETLARFRTLLVELLDLGTQPPFLFLSALVPAARLRRLLALGLEPVRLGPWKVDLGRALPWTRLMRLVREVDASLYAEMARRRAEGVEGREDVLSLLMQARDEHGQPMGDQQLRDEAITLLTAGHETSATTLSWTFHLLLQHPDVEEKLRAELRQVAGEGPVPPEQVNRLEYLDATLKEAMRLLPVIPAVGRELQRPMKLGPWELPAGIAVLPCIYLANHRPDSWPEPERFDPERFLGKRVSPYEYFPFGGGARRCLGMAFATYEMKIVLAEVLRRVRLRSVSRGETRVVRRGVTFAPSEGVPVLVESRS